MQTLLEMLYISRLTKHVDSAVFMNLLLSYFMGYCITNVTCF